MLTITITTHGDAHAPEHVCCDPSRRAIDSLLANTFLGRHGAVVSGVVPDDAEAPVALTGPGKRPIDAEPTDELQTKKPRCQTTKRTMQGSSRIDLGEKQQVIDLKEEARVRQRGYERKYRLKTRRRYREIRDEWLEKEMELYDILRRRAANKAEHKQVKGLTIKDKMEWLIKKEKALRHDRILLQTASFWHYIFQRRVLENAGLEENSTPPPVCTRQEWAILDRFYLGPSVIKPFRPLHFRFNL